MRLFQVIGAALLLSNWAGCKIYSAATLGEEGQLSFYEPNDYPGESASSPYGFDKPIALGARADMWLTGPGLGVVKSAAIQDPTIVSLSFESYPLKLRGQAVGSTTIRVVSTNGTDTLPVHVVKADGAQLWIPSTPGLLDPGDQYFGKGYALRPGASLRVAGAPTAGTQVLLGFDILAWNIDPAGLTDGGDGASVNTRVIKSKGVAGTSIVTTQLGGSVEVATLSASDVPTLKLYSFASVMKRPPETNALAAADLALFYVAGNDAAGRYVLPATSDDASFSVMVVDGDAVVLEAQHAGHAVTVRGCTGTGHVRISYLGATRLVPIEVSAADKSCP